MEDKIKHPRMISLSVCLPKKPGRYLCKVDTHHIVPGKRFWIKELDYVTLSDGNLDWDTDDLPEGSEVLAFCKIKY